MNNIQLNIINRTEEFIFIDKLQNIVGSNYGRKNNNIIVNKIFFDDVSKLCKLYNLHLSKTKSKGFTDAPRNYVYECGDIIIKL